MTNYPTDMCAAAADAPYVTNMVARCAVCGIKWQVRSPNKDDAQGCHWCNAPKNAVMVISEEPRTFGAIIR